MNTILNAKSRSELGKKTSQLRKNTLTPCVVYNAKGESKNISISTPEIIKALKDATRTTIVDMDLEGKVIKALIKEIQKNPATDEILHVSFFEIDEDESMIFDIPFVLTGISPAVKNNLGILVQPVNSLQFKCKLKDMVPEISIDISKLEHPGQTIKVKEVNIPESLKLHHIEDLDTVVVTITEIQKVEEVKAEETTATEGEASASEEAESTSDEKSENKE